MMRSVLQALEEPEAGTATLTLASLEEGNNMIAFIIGEKAMAVGERNGK